MIRLLMAILSIAVFLSGSCYAQQICLNGQCYGTVKKAPVAGVVKNTVQTVASVPVKVGQTVVGVAKTILTPYGNTTTYASVSGCNSGGSSGGYSSVGYGSSGTPVTSSYGCSGTPVESVRTPSRAVTPSLNGHYGYPGDLAAHLRNRHGAIPDGLSHEELLNLHDSLHRSEAFGMRQESYTFKPVRSALRLIFRR